MLENTAQPTANEKRPHITTVVGHGSFSLSRSQWQRTFPGITGHSENLLKFLFSAQRKL